MRFSISWSVACLSYSFFIYLPTPLHPAPQRSIESSDCLSIYWGCSVCIFWRVVIGLWYIEVGVEKAWRENGRRWQDIMLEVVRIPRFPFMLHLYEQLGVIHLTSFKFLFLQQLASLRCWSHGLILTIISDNMWWCLVNWDALYRCVSENPFCQTRNS